ncbi:hypothetical protein [Specibacter sp. NPDC078692]|uniref:hypothetical protein n=1 Tax=Specibacter sp. NPDC078692 TaxID=3155818 RepID=UPI00341AC1F5
MASGGVRVVRGWAGACVATFVSVLSHVLAGGGPPELSILFLALALSGLVCTLLAGRVLSWWRMAVAVVLSQSGFHWLFSANAAMADTSAVLPKGVHAGHDMSNMTFMTVPGSAPMAMTHDGPMMWLSHVLAAAVTVAVLRHGEVSTVRLIRALRFRLIRLLPAVHLVSIFSGTRILPTTWPVLALPNLGVPLLAMRHRGPPVLSLVS